MTAPLPELDELRRRLELLRHDPAIVAVTDSHGVLSLRSLPLAEIARLIRPAAGKDEGYHFLMAASELNRSSLKDAAQGDDALVVPERQRKAQAIRVRLPVTIDFDTVAARVVALRQGDLKRKARGQVEQLFRDRLVEEGIPLLISPRCGRYPDSSSPGASPMACVQTRRPWIRLSTWPTPRPRDGSVTGSPDHHPSSLACSSAGRGGEVPTGRRGLHRSDLLPGGDRRVSRLPLERDRGAPAALNVERPTTARRPDPTARRRRRPVHRTSGTDP